MGNPRQLSNGVSLMKTRQCDCAEVLNLMAMLVECSRPHPYLTKYQQGLIAKEVETTTKPYWQIADEWLTTESSISKIARKFGVGRKQ